MASARGSPVFEPVIEIRDAVHALGGGEGVAGQELVALGEPLVHFDEQGTVDGAAGGGADADGAGGAVGGGAGGLGCRGAAGDDGAGGAEEAVVIERAEIFAERMAVDEIGGDDEVLADFALYAEGQMARIAGAVAVGVDVGALFGEVDVANGEIVRIGIGGLL